MELLLQRPSTDVGFGFSVSWLRPPRIERVEAGKPAANAGLHVGDRVLGVGGLIMGENVDIYHGIKGAGLLLRMAVERGVPDPPQDAHAPQMRAAPPPAKFQAPAAAPRPVSQPPQPWNKIHVRQELLTSLSDTQKRLFSAQLRFFKQTVSALDRYLIPAGKTGLLTQQEMKTIFGGVISIITVMARLLHCVNRGDCGLEDANLDHLPELSTAYSEYASSLPTSSTTLSAKMGNSKFTQFILDSKTPYDLTYVLFSPLYHLRHTLQLTSSLSLGSGAKLQAQLLQLYTQITFQTEHCILEPTSSPLVTVQELEARLVSPTVKLQKLTKWLFGSRLGLRDGGSWTPVFGFLFTDTLLIVTQPTKDRLFFVKQQVALKELASLHFSGGGDLDFKLVFSPVKRFKLLRSEKAVHLRVAGVGLKAMWKLLLQKQIIELNTAGGFPSSSSAFSLSEFTEKFPEVEAKRPETIREESADDIVNNNNNEAEEQIKIRVQPPPRVNSAPTFSLHVPTEVATPPVKPQRVAKEAKAKAKAAKEEEPPKPAEPTPPPPPRVVNANGVGPTPPIPAPRTILPSSATTRVDVEPRKPPIPRPRSYQDSPAPQHRSYAHVYMGAYCDPRIPRDYPELFGITPRDRTAFIKAIGDRPQSYAGGGGLGLGMRTSVSAGNTPAMGIRTIAPFAVEPFHKPSLSKPIEFGSDLRERVGALDLGAVTEQQQQPRADRNFMRLRSAQLRAALAAPPPAAGGVPTSPELSSNDSGISDETAGAGEGASSAQLEVRNYDYEPLSAPQHQNSNFRRQNSNSGTNFGHHFYKGTTTAAREREQQRRAFEGGFCGLDCVVDHLNCNHSNSSCCSSSTPNNSNAFYSPPPPPQPLIVKISTACPERQCIVRHHSARCASNGASAVLETVESTESEESEGGSPSGTSGSGSASGSASDVASASPAGNGNGGGTTEPSWSSEEDFLDRPPAPALAPPRGLLPARAPNPVATFYKLTDLSESDGDADAEEEGGAFGSLNRYGSYERLDQLPLATACHLPRSTACFGLADADKFGGGHDFDYLSDEEEELEAQAQAGPAGGDKGGGGVLGAEVEYDFADQVEDNTYSVSRLGPLPPVLEEEYEEDSDYEAFLARQTLNLEEDEDEEEEAIKWREEEEQWQDYDPHEGVTLPPAGEGSPSPSACASPGGTAASRARLRGNGSYNFTVARIAGLYARTSISPLRILRDLWLRRRLRDGRGGGGGHGAKS